MLALVVSLVLMAACCLLANWFKYIAKPQKDGCEKLAAALFSGVPIVITTLPAGLTAPRGSKLSQFLGCGLLIAARNTVASLLIFFGYRLRWTELWAKPFPEARWTYLTLVPNFARVRLTLRGSSICTCTR